jgi:HTH-type transcriptional regulator, glycine betaine synthesis regulator
VSGSLDPTPPRANVDRLEQQVIDFFADGVRVLGLPRSIGEIYGLLFISTTPLSLDDLVERLAISKGSVSQGLRTLKTLGAIREATPNGNRRTYYQPAVDLKRLAGGFIKEQIRPHLESGKSKLEELTHTIDTIDDPQRRDFVRERVDRLDNWMRKSAHVLPVLQKLLGS